MRSVPFAQQAVQFFFAIALGSKAQIAERCFFLSRRRLGLVLCGGAAQDALWVTFGKTKVTFAPGEADRPQRNENAARANCSKAPRPQPTPSPRSLRIQI